jgi:predicted nucleic acid-binding protein
VLLAAADRSDPAHERCRELLESHPGPLITTELVLAETGWLLDRQLGPVAEAALYRSVADGEIVVEPLSRADWTRIAELTERYSDQHLGGVDAGLIAVAERLGLTTIATLDRRHFGVVRPNHAKVLTLIP